jgi:hypothetical protein
VLEIILVEEEDLKVRMVVLMEREYLGEVLKLWLVLEELEDQMEHLELLGLEGGRFVL